MHNLDRFSEVELDMREVKNIGQGVAAMLAHIDSTEDRG
jgi:hypothetical protein